VATRGRVVLGGTFDHLHVGHEALLTTAFRAGRHVGIGLTTGGYLAGHPKPRAGRIQPYSVRRRRLAAWLRARFPPNRWTITPISDAFGGSVGPGVAGLVVSADTIEGGRRVNAERARRGRRPVPVLVVPLVLADDLRPVSSRRVRAGEIDRNGRRISPIPVRATVEVRADRPAVVRALRSAFPRARIVSRASAAALEVAVRRAGRSGRTVRLRTGAVALRPVRVDAANPREFARGLEAVLRRSRGTNPLSRGSR
jgi:pantetheine-phosphate adenylyltransferase